MSKQWDPRTDMPSLQGKVAVVTGGNSDIGCAIVKLLALRGAKVYFTARSEANAQKTRDTIRINEPEITEENIEWLPLDLTDLKSITAAADTLKRKERKVDILINNAGAGTKATEPVGYGWEIHMTVNFVGAFVFINRLLPLLETAAAEKEADVRIITMSTTAQHILLPSNFKFNFNSPTALTKPVLSYPWLWRYLGRFMFNSDLIRYSVSKAATLILAQELQRQLSRRNLPILCMAVHPGEVNTSGFLAVNTAPVRLLVHLTFLTPDQGAVTPLLAATATEIRRDSDRYKGQFIMPTGKIGNVNQVTKDDAQVRGLWQTTTDEVNKQLAIDDLPPLEPW